MKWFRAATAVAAAAAAVVWACGSSGGSSIQGSPPPPDGGVDAGSDAGSDAGMDAGMDAGIDGGTDAGSDAGSDAGGYVPPPAIDFPNVPGWSFLGPQNNGPHDVYQVTADDGGNIWVAGGEDGLFLLRSGSTQFVRFTMADGLRPYGYLPDGSDPIGPKYLSVIAVTGGAAGTVFVGYQGQPNCEGAWDNPANRPTATSPGLAYIYKSGDADRVTVDANDKLTVVHYDIFSGPGIVAPEPDGREKLCTIYRIVYNPVSKDLWFGGNHGFAWGDPNYAGNPTCNGQIACSGVVEHSHPAFNGCLPDKSSPNPDATCPTWGWITEDYRGIALDPSGDVWFGGAARSTRWYWSRFGGDPASRFYGAQTMTEGPSALSNRLDVWPDLVPESQTSAPFPGERIDDLVFGMAATGSGVWVGSVYLGLRFLGPNGSLVADASNRLSSYYTYSHTFTNPNTGNVESATYPGASVGALALDSSDGSLWVGNHYVGGIDRLNTSNGDQRYAKGTFADLATMSIDDIRMMGTGPSRKVLVAFRQSASTAGFVAIYSGN
jgi:hypothetical protein